METKVKELSHRCGKERKDSRKGEDSGDIATSSLRKRLKLSLGKNTFCFSWSDSYDGKTQPNKSSEFGNFHLTIIEFFSSNLFILSFSATPCSLMNALPVNSLHNFLTKPFLRSAKREFNLFFTC